MRPWLDDAEIDWSTPSSAPAIRARRRPEPTASWRRARAALLVIALAAGAAWAFADGHDTTALPPAPPLQVPERGASSVAKPAGALTAIAHCESRGDPTAVSADGAHRGKYQFDATTWQSVGGSGDPALAPEHEQDRRAVALAARRGTAPWPVCGSAAGGH